MGLQQSFPREVIDHQGFNSLGIRSHEEQDCCVLKLNKENNLRRCPPFRRAMPHDDTVSSLSFFIYRFTQIRMFVTTAICLSLEPVRIPCSRIMARDITDIVEGKLDRHPRTKASSTAPALDVPPLAFQTNQTADYIARMSAEMAVMSSAAGLHLLAHLLHLVKAQAEIEAKTARDK